MAAMNAAAPLSGSGGVQPSGAAAAATPWQPEATRLMRNNRSSVIDATMALMLAANTQGQSDWLSTEPGHSSSPLASPHRKFSTLQQLGAASPTSAQFPADPSASWMNFEMGEWHNDAESWLVAAPKQASSEAEVLPLPRLSTEQLKQVRESQQQQAQQQRHWQPSAGATAGGSAASSPASRRVSLAQPSRAATPAGSRAPSARPVQQRFATPSPPGRQQQESDRRQSTASLAVPSARRAILASTRPATATTSPSKQLWSPSGATAAAKAASRAPASARTSRAGGPSDQPARLSISSPAAQRQAPHKALPSAAQPQLPMQSALAVGELPPAVKVAAWLHSPAGPTACVPASRLPTKIGGTAGVSAPPKVRTGSAAADLLAAQASPHASSSDGGSPWRIGVPPVVASLAAPASAAPAAGGFTSRIPRPATTGAALAASSSPTRGTADGTAHMGGHRSELALKQLAQRALAAGSSGSSPPAPRAVHTRRPSSLLGFGSGEARAVASAESSPPSSPTRRSIHVPAPRSVAGSESRCSSAGSATTPRSAHRLSSSSSSPAASPLAKTAGSLSGGSSVPDCQLLEAQALAATSLAAAQASARQAAAECALLARASPAAWEAAQTVASSCSSQAAGGSCGMLDQQLAQLERLSQCLSEASSSVSELCFMEAVAHSRRPSSNSRGAQRSLPGSRPSSHPGSTGSRSQAEADC